MRPPRALPAPVVLDPASAGGARAEELGLKVVAARDQGEGGVEEQQNGVEEGAGKGARSRWSAAHPSWWVAMGEEEGRQQGEDQAARHGGRRPTVLVNEVDVLQEFYKITCTVIHDLLIHKGTATGAQLRLQLQPSHYTNSSSPLFFFPVKSLLSFTLVVDKYVDGEAQIHGLANKICRLRKYDASGCRCRKRKICLLFPCGDGPLRYQLQKLIDVNSTEVDWECSFYLNLVAHTSLSVALCRWVHYWWC